MRISKRKKINKVSQILTEIEDLAEFIAEQYLIDGKVDLDHIAFDKDIIIIYESEAR